jgi:2-polyprenyl-3-methyl-5-hydroxy-6-metoxy-1,4-benzoquinol methylase
MTACGIDKKEKLNMSRLGELALRAYAGMLPNRPAKSTSTRSTSYHQWQYDTSAAMFASLPNFDFQNKRVLELGCGLGGRALWLARNGALEVLGIDINAAEVS